MSTAGALSSVMQSIREIPSAAPPGLAPSLEQFGYKQELKRALTTRDLVIYGMIFMVPIAPYSVFGFVYTDAKGMVPLAYLIGLVGMFFTAMSYAAMSRAFRSRDRCTPTRSAGFTR